MTKAQVLVKLFLILSINLYAPSLKHLIRQNKIIPKVVDKKLDLSNLKLTDISGIESIENIDQVEELNLGDNKLSKVDALAKIDANLKILDISSNRIKNILPLAKFILLESLYIYGNKFKDVDVATLTGTLPRLQFFDVRDKKVDEPFEQIDDADSEIGNEEDDQSGQSEKCSICWGYQSDIETKCKHFFCKDCLIEWINTKRKAKQSPKCPNCRTPLSNAFIDKVKKQD